MIYMLENRVGDEYIRIGLLREFRSVVICVLNEKTDCLVHLDVRKKVAK